MKTLVKLAVVVFAIIVAISFISRVSDKSDGEQNETPEQKKAESAYFAAVKFCEQYARSSTKITTDGGGDYLDGKALWSTNWNGSPDWYASGWIDCQNKSGAMRHQTWAAHVAEVGSDWRLTFLRIGDDQIIGGN